MQILVHRQDQQLGPFTEPEVREKLASGELALGDYVWWEGQADWLPISQTHLGQPETAPTPGPVKKEVPSSVYQPRRSKATHPPMVTPPRVGLVIGIILGVMILTGIALYFSLGLNKTEDLLNHAIDTAQAKNYSIIMPVEQPTPTPTPEPTPIAAPDTTNGAPAPATP